MPRFLRRRLGLILPPLLLCGCGNVNADLMEAAADRDNDAVKVLTAEGADPSTALIMALQRGRVGLEFRIRSLNRGLGHHCVAPEF